MSWLNLNQSLSNIKGQISSFANEVLSEGIVDDSHPFSEINKANDRIKELQVLCASQDQEIASLRQRNSELLSNNCSPEHDRAIPNGNVSEKEDEGSWFWDPPPDKDLHNSNSDTEILQLKNEISLLKDDAKRKKEQYDRTIKELEAEMRHLKYGENCKGDCKKDKESLEDEVKRLKDENKGLVTDIEDLESQHQTAVDKLLDLKKGLQKNFELLKADHEKTKQMNDALVNETKELKSSNTIVKMQADDFSEKNKKMLSELDTLQHKYINLEKVHRLLTEDAEKFQEDNQELQEENSRLQEECARLQTVLQDLQNIETVPKEVFLKLQADYERLKDNMSASIMSNNEDAVDSNNIDDNAKSVIENLKREITELQNKLTGNDDFKQLIGENNSCKAKIEDLEKQLHNSEHRHEERLTGLLEKYINFDLPTDFVGQRSEECNSNAINRIENALRVLSEYKRQKDRLEHDLNQTKKSVSALQTQINDLTSENELLNADLTHYEHEALEMKKNNDFLIAEIGTLRNSSKLQPISETHEESLVKLESELEDCSRLNKSFEAELEIIDRELGEVKSERDKLKGELADLKSKYEHMSQQLDIYQSETNACEKFDKQKDMVILELQTSLKETQTEFDKLKQQLQNVMVENEKRKIDYTILDNEKIILMNSISELKAEMQAKSILDDYVNECEEEKVSLDEKLNQISLQLNQTLGEKGLLEESVIELKRSLVTLETKYNDLVSSVEAENAQKEILSSERMSAERELSTLRKFVNEAETEKDRLKREVTVLNEKLANDEAVMIDLQRKLELLNAEFKTISDSNAIMENDLLELRQNKTDNELVLMQEKNLSYRNEISDLQRQNVSLKAKLEETGSQLELVKQEIITKNIIIDSEKQASSELTKNLESALAELNASEQKVTQLVKNLDSKVKEGQSMVSADKVILLEKQLTETERTLSDTRQKMEVLENSIKSKEGRVALIETEKEELIKLVTLKHTESVSYHAEIQRLNSILLEKDKEMQELLEQTELRIQDITKSAQIPDGVQDRLHDLENRCEAHLISISELSEQLAQEQKSSYMAKQDRDSMQERRDHTEKELRRLRDHLTELESDYTTQLVQAERKNAELTDKLASIEVQAKKSSTLYTSNSIRANQEVETLRNQLRLVELQRDDIQTRLDLSEDRNSKHTAALTNLQCVLEQFQLDKERDVDGATLKIKAELESAAKQHDELRAEIKWLNEKLHESSNGLKAASRLSGQLDAKNAQLSEMKEQVLKLQTEVKVADEKYRNAIGNQQDRVDKSLVKNLVIGYIQTNNQQKHKDRNQVLKILSSVLDFNQSESERVGLLSGRAHLGAQGESLTQEFIKFLEKESRPAQLPTMLGLTSPSSVQGSRPTTPGSRTESELGHPEQHRKHSRNISTGSQNILFQSLDGAEPERSSPSNNSLLDADHVTASRLILGPADTGITQTRNTEGAILKNVLKDV